MSIMQNLVSYGKKVVSPVIINLVWNTGQSGMVLPLNGGGMNVISGSRVRFTVQDSSNCGGPNPNIQTGYAQASVVVGSTPYYFIPTLSGMGEAQDAGYEKMVLKLNSVQIQVSAAPGGGLGCATGLPVVVSTTVPGPYLLAANTTHTIRVDFTTSDALYHVGCYYQLDTAFTTT